MWLSARWKSKGRSKRCERSKKATWQEEREKEYDRMLEMSVERQIWRTRSFEATQVFEEST